YCLHASSIMHYIACMTPEHQVLLSAVGAAVRRLRDDRAMTRRDLAERSGVSQRFLAELESGQGNISVARLQDVARALGSSAGELLTRFLAETDVAVLATGGGIVTDPGSFKLLQKRCRTVWLQATPEDHWRRVLEQGDVRPGAANPQAQVELRALLKAREPLYAEAELSVDTSRIGVDGAVEE